MPPIGSSNTIFHQQVSNNDKIFEDCIEGRIEELEKYFENINGLDINRTDRNGRTLLHSACYHGHTGIVARLLEFAQLELNLCDKSQSTALYLACLRGNIDAADLILQQHTAENPLILDDYNLQSAFAIACKRGLMALVRRFLSVPDFSPDTADKEGYTPLFQAVRQGHTEIVSLLVEREDIQFNYKDNNNQTALMVACFHNHIDIVRLLLKKTPAEINHKDKSGQTAFHILCKKNHCELVNDFLKLDGVEWNAIDNDEQTPLLAAFLARNFELTLQLLLEVKINQAVMRLTVKHRYRSEAFLDEINIESHKNRKKLAVMFYALGIEPSNKSNHYFTLWCDFVDNLSEAEKANIYFTQTSPGANTLRQSCLFSLFSNKVVIPDWFPPGFLIEGENRLESIQQSFESWMEVRAASLTKLKTSHF